MLRLPPGRTPLGRRAIASAREGGKDDREKDEQPDPCLAPALIIIHKLAKAGWAGEDLLPQGIAAAHGDVKNAPEAENLREPTNPM